jgi:hypothetical protein
LQCKAQPGGECRPHTVIAVEIFFAAAFNSFSTLLTSKMIAVKSISTMKERPTFEIAEKVFKTKTELKTFTKTILNKYVVNNSLDKSDLEFITELLKRHPEYENKIGKGINDIVVRTDMRWQKTKCFHIVRVDGTETDFSYLSCIDNDTRQEPIKMFKLSARSAIADQVVQHLVNYKSRMIDADGYMPCEKTRTKIKYEDATVDHTSPMTFNKIVEDFLTLKNIVVSEIEFTGFGDNEYYKQFKDENLKQEFSDYHREVAILRVISKQSNLTQKKKNFEHQTQINF